VNDANDGTLYLLLVKTATGVPTDTIPSLATIFAMNPFSVD
jgi:hypothetical protein